MLDTEAIIAKYKTGEWPMIREIIGDNPGEVIGDAVDEDNRLYYVIRRGKEITVELAENQTVTFSRLTPPDHPSVRVEN